MEEQSLAVPVSSTKPTRREGGNGLLIVGIVVVSLASFAVLGLLASSLLTQDSRPLRTVEERDAVVAVAQAKANPKDFDAQVEAAGASIFAEEYDQALLYADRAVNLDPKSQTAKLAKARALQASGDLTQARKLLEQIRKTVDSSSAMYASTSLILAVIDEAEGKLASAVDHLKVAQAADPTNAERLVVLGGLEERIGKPDDAAASYGEALRYIPDYEPALAALRAMKSGAADYELAKVAWQAGNKDEARRLMEQAAKESPTVAWVQVALGEFRAMIGDKDGATNAYRAALAIDPKNEEATAGLSSLN